MDGIIERVSQILEYMILMYVMNKQTSCTYFLYLVEFTYKNRYQTSMKMSPFEAMYGIKCNIIVISDDPMDRVMIGPNILKEVEKDVLFSQKIVPCIILPYNSSL
jgi:hypothetical protein